MRRVLLLIATTALSLPVYADVILDNYVGGRDHGFGDVIADPGDNSFDISSMDVSLSGTMLTVTINTNFGPGSGLGSFGQYTQSGDGIAFGDLFLSSTGWHPYGSASDGYKTDRAANGTLWDYGVALTDRWDAGSSANLYALDTSGGNTEVKLTEDFITGATFRDGQETAVDTSQATLVDNAANFATSTGQITFILDIAGTALADAASIGLHWNMTCGNDTIEGQFGMPTVSVPAPSSLTALLVGLGFLGFSLARRRRRVAA